jgi:uracil-DNA glycosylase family 4
MDTYAKIKLDLQNFKALPIAVNCLNPVMGVGNLNSQIVFIGEAPGAKEDLEGLPFVGRSGKLLDELLESINLNRQEIYITNIVKFRPPENRDPTSAEKLACTPFLTRELNLIQPKLVCSLGRHAMNFFNPTAKISEAHGNPLQISNPEFSNLILFPLYHPAVGLYNPKQKATLFEDFQKLNTLLQTNF